ncbi:TetR family transcriptional regulator [Burkholderia vietnamiensis]|nr:TetR family transcriptional regulator [Burkholderia vietnamiensis]
MQRAILRVKNKGLKLSISAVAVEAGVSAGLVHNTYPDIAEEIRAQVGRDTRRQRDAKAVEVKKVRKQLKTLRAERDAALADIARLASINETLRQEVAMLQAAVSGKIVVLPPP